MAIKLYKTINPGTLSTVVKGTRIVFSGMMHMPGMYSTDNTALQQAIEADPDYGKAFMLAFSSGEPEAAVTPHPVEAPKPEAEKPKPAGRPKVAKSSGQQEQPAV
jgi:hypothetical protein